MKAKVETETKTKTKKSRALKGAAVLGTTAAAVFAFRKFKN